MNTKSVLFVGVSALVMVACGSSGASSSGSGSTNGMLGGKSFAVDDAVSFVMTLPNSGDPPVTEVNVVMTNFAGACGIGHLSGSQGWVSITVIQGTDPKTYDIDAGYVSVEYQADFGDTCHDYSWTTAEGGGGTSSKANSFQEATSGTVTLTTVNSSTVEGSFDATFPSGDHLTGSFKAGACAPPTGDSTDECPAQ